MSLTTSFNLFLTAISSVDIILVASELSCLFLIPSFQSGRVFVWDSGKGLAGKSTLHRLETAEEVVGSSERYKKIADDGGAIENYFVESFLNNMGSSIGR